MRQLLGSWVLISVAFVFGWGIHSTMVARNPREVGRTSSRLGRFGLLGLFTTLAGKLMFGGVALAAVGGLAVEGSLPKPVQNAVSAAAESVGLEIPSSEDENVLRIASPSVSKEGLVVRRRIFAVIDKWEGEKDCEYLRALAKAARATAPGRCPKEEGEGRKAVTDPGSAPSDSVIPQPTTEAQPSPPSDEASPAESPPAEPPAESPPAEPPAESPPAEPPAESPPAEPNPEEPNPVGPPPEELPPVEPSP